MGDEIKVVVSFENLRQFWADVVIANTGNTKFPSYDCYPDASEDFGGWLFRKRSRKEMVITDFLTFECRIMNRTFKPTATRLNQIVKRFKNRSIEQTISLEQLG